jgi:hypothetical protein
MKSMVWMAIGVLLLAGKGAFAQTITPIQERVMAAQSKGKAYAVPELFSNLGNPEAGMQQVLKRGTLLKLNNQVLKELKENRPEHVVIDLPYEGGKTMRLEMVKNEVLDPDFRVTTSSGSSFRYQEGLYYQGIVRGNVRSVAALSMVGDEIMGVVDVEGIGNMILGVLENDIQNRYAFFRSEDLQHNMQMGCDTEEEPQVQLSQTAEQLMEVAENTNKCVKIYFECEYDMFLSRSSSVQSTIDYMTGIYNVVKALYDNEYVTTAISEIFVWNTPDDYPTTSTRDALYAFQSRRGSSFNGNLAHLVSRGAPTGGGVAFLNVTCTKGSAYAYSYIHGSYNQFPTYSWTVSVIAHEMGHNLGSSHTHACSWDVNGDGIASEMIDGCGPNKGYSEGSCPVAPLPTNGGTVMSYCHLVSGVGINFNNGFGPLPGDRIRSRVYNASCLTACNTCPTMVSISKTDISCFGGNNGSATATGSGSTGGYTYLWNTGATTATISGLSAGTYSVTVRGENGTGCPVTSSVTIMQPAALNANAAITPESAPGASNGSITLSVSGGTAPYTYLWSNGATTKDIINIPGGEFTVTIKDSKNCTTQRSFTVGSNGCGNILTSFPFTEGFETGLGIFTQASYDNYDWIRQSGQTPNNRTGPSGAFQGSWYLFAQGKNNSGEAAVESPCLSIADLTNSSIDFAYSMNGSSIGTLRLEVSTNNGGTWTTLWSRSGNQGSNWLTASVSLENHKTSFTKIRFVAVAGGNFGDIAIDGITLRGQQAISCTAPTLSFSQTNVSCFGASNGSASVNATGGTSPYTYLWSNGATTASLSNLSAGTYNVTVTATGGCSSAGEVTITQPAKIDVATQAVPVSAPGASDGAVNLELKSGGTAPFNYRWSNGADTKDLLNVPAGTYTVVVNDAVGCETNASETVTEPQITGCTSSIGLPYAESFESGLGIWRQRTDDQFDWRINSSGTPTGNTGPSSAANGSFYLYTEANDASSGSRAIIESPCFDLSNISQAEFSFAWHMFGNQMGTMILEISEDAGTTWRSLWSRSGNASNSWTTQKVSLNAYAGKSVTFRFTGILSNGVRGDMALDDIRITGIANNLMMITGTPGQTSFELRRVYPNPTSGVLQVEMYSTNSTTANISLVDVTGRTTDYGRAQLFPGHNTIRINVTSSSNGMYMLRVMENGRSHTKPIMIMR